MATTRYVYFGNQYIGETDGNNVAKQRYVNEPDAYTHLLGQHDVAANEDRYYHFNAIGSTGQVTDESETVTDEITYDSWGNVLARTGMNLVPFQYVGEHGYYREDNTNNYYIMARMYSPKSIRWLSIDPLMYSLSKDAYSYSSRSPIQRYDPSGLINYTKTLATGCEEPGECKSNCPRDWNDCRFTINVWFRREPNRAGREVMRVTFKFSHAATGCSSDINRAPESFIRVSRPSEIPGCVLNNDMFDDNGNVIPEQIPPACRGEWATITNDEIDFSSDKINLVEWDIRLEVGCACSRSPRYPEDYGSMTSKGKYKGSEIPK